MGKTVKTLLTLMLFVLVSFTGSAYDFESGGIYYNITSTTNKTVEVTYGKGTPPYEYMNTYSGSISIPSTVSYSGITYAVTSIGELSFYSCGSLIYISIPTSVTAIKRNAFRYCRGLTSITIPNSVTSIGKSAFEFCTRLTSVTIPNSVSSIGEAPFSACEKLQNINVSSENQFYVSVDGVLFTKDMKILMQYPTGKTGTSYTIPNSVTSIGAFSFYMCKKLTSITIPSSVISIGERAFGDCSNIQSIYCYATKPPKFEYSPYFGSITSNSTLHIPSGCTHRYKSAEYWKDFTNIVDDLEYSSEGIYLGLIGFNRSLTEYPIGLLDQYTVSDYTSFVDNLTIDRNTLLYYAMQTALQKITQPKYPDNLSNAVIITFTDGLDQGSLAKNPSMDTDAQYTTYLAQRIADTRVNGKKIQAYTIGVKGLDISDEELFMSNLQALASKPENAHPVENIAEVEQNLNNIYEELSTMISYRDIKISVPEMSNGAFCRFTLDGITNADKVNSSKVYIEGTYNKSTKTLNNVIYKGLTSTSGSSVTGIVDPDNDLNIIFTFNDCRDTSGNILAINSKSAIDQWTKTGSGIWQHNEEMNKEGDINIDEIKTSATIMFLIDCSSSLGDDFSKVKEIAKGFIRRLAGVDVDAVDDILVDSPSSDEGDVDWSCAQYYNLQGMQIMNPTKGLYIQRVGRHTRKIMLR